VSGASLMSLKRRLPLFLSLVFALSASTRAHGQAPPAPPPPAPAPPPPAPAPPPPAPPPTPPAPQAPAGDDEDTADAAEAEKEAAEAEKEAAEAEKEAAAAEAEAEADSEDLADEDLGEEDPARAPPKGKGVIWGVVKETEFKEELVEAPVQVVGTKVQAVTDMEGRFRLELPPGTYSIRVSYELHESSRFDRVEVTAGKVIRLDVDLTPDKTAVDVFEVVEEADKASLEGLVLARQRSTVVGDGIGRAEISKTTDRNAAQAAQRVVGANVVGGRFVYVRGLGERYTNALIDGVPLPSPEPDRAAVPLDLFPTGVLNSLNIAKTFTPDSPGDFAGGSVRIETREVPKGPVLQLSARGAYNTQSTFHDRLTYRGGGLDWLGIDDGTRALPDGFPTEKIDNLPPDQRTAAGRALNSYMSTQDAGTPPDHSVGVTAGNGWDFGNDRKLGVLAALNWGRSYSVRRDETVRIFKADSTDPRGFTEIRDYRATSGVVSVNWGAFGSLTYRFNAQHQLSLEGIRTTLADDRAQHLTGFHEGRDANIFATRLAFVTRALNFGLLRGEHRFPKLGRAELTWNLTLSEATRDEPDRRDSVWSDGRGNLDSTYAYTDAGESGRHFYSDQSEKQYGSGLDWTQPLGEGDTKLKAGALISLRNRNFHSRALTLQPRKGDTGTTQASSRSHSVLSCPSGDINACNDALFVGRNIGHDQEHALELTENRTAGDRYDAFLNIYAGYLMADLQVTDNLRVVLGERIEHTRQVIEPFDENWVKNPTLRARIGQTDILPAVSGTWSMSAKTKLRASVTRTLARPQLRELAPFAFQDYFGGRVTSGNPDLEMTNITNLDLRLEHFPTLREVLAASIFFKDFVNPIESVILAGGEEGSVNYRNARGAQLIGLELEARQWLEFLTPVLKDLTFGSNLTLSHSEIRVRNEETLNLTTLKRPLVHQAPWVLNLSLSYAREKTGTTATALFNVVGPRIAFAGSGDLPDVYEHSRGMLDLTVQQKVIEHVQIKLEGKNLLNSAVLLTQGCGGDGLFGGTWHLGCSNGEAEAVSRYTEGASFAVSGSYDF
jgi:TonB-dependent receptor